MTYYISPSGNDSDPGTISQPFLTLAHAESVVVAGDTVQIANGTYAGFTTGVSGGSSSRITYQAATAGGVNLTSPITITDSYRTFNGFTGTNVSDRLFDILGANNLVQNTTIIISTYGTGYGIKVGADANTGGEGANNNIIEGLRLLCTSATGQLIHGVIFGGGGTGNVLRNSYINGSYYGIVDKAQNSSLIYNNVFNFTTTGLNSSIYCKGSTDSWYYNNVCRNTGSGFCFLIQESDGGTPDPSGVLFLNNVCIKGSGDPAIDVGAPGVGAFTSDYNIYQYTSGTVFFVNPPGTAYTSLAAWRAATGQDAHSVAGTPIFANASGTMSQLTDYKPLPGSPAIDAGTTISGRTTDAAGAAITATPEIGPYESAAPAGNIYYISTSGSDANPGTLALPWRNFEKLGTLGPTFLNPGDIVYVRAGTYLSTAANNVSANVPINGWHGTPTREILISRYPPDFTTGGRVVYDCTNVDHHEDVYGIRLTNCSYVRFFGISVKGPTQTSYLKPSNSSGIICGSWWHINSPNCITENCEGSYTMTPFRLDADPGLGDNKLYLNCDAHHASDPYTGGPTGPWNNSDGFSRTLNHAANVIYRGCRSWFNSDDGWDSIHTAEKITYDGCWAIMNGYSAEGVPYPDGDGNGFKMGGGTEAASTTVASRFVNRCVSFGNKANGFDQNDGIFLAQMFNNSAINNGQNDWKFGYHAPIAHILRNNLSYGNDIMGYPTDAGSWVEDHNTWDGDVTVDGSDFINLTASEFLGARQANGNLPIISAAHLAPGSDLIDAGIDVGLPFNDAAPDMGAFETGLISGDSGDSGGDSGTPAGTISSIIIDWTPCDPMPDEGYQIIFRAIGDITYTSAGFFTTSPAIIPVAYPAGTLFEGAIQSACGDVAWTGGGFGGGGCVPVSVFTVTLPNGGTGSPYSYSVPLNPAWTTPIDITIITAPSWMTIAIVGTDIIFSGTPDTEGTDIAVQFTLTNDCGSAEIDTTITVTICNPAIAYDITLPDGVVGIPYSYSAPFPDPTWTTPVTITITDAPDWLTIDIVGTSIVFGGTPDAIAGLEAVNFTLHNPCSDDETASFGIFVSVGTDATADAGDDQEICFTNTAPLDGSIGGAADNSIWTTDGDGTFDDDTLLNAVYTPGSGDISLGIVTLTLTAYIGASPMTSDTMILTIDPAAIATFDYTVPNAGSTYCQALPSNPSPINPVFPNFTGGGIAGTFSSPFDPSVVIDPDTGAIDTENTPPGTYTIFNTVSNACGVDIQSATITINPLPVKTISYPPGTFTTGDAPQAPTIGGAPSVTTLSWTASPGGLTINATNGTITPSTSTPGTYTIIWTFTTAACPNTATTTVTIT